MNDPTDFTRLLNQHVLVTGGAGFIGSHLLSALQEVGAQVTVIDDLSTGSKDNVPEGMPFIHGSILDQKLVKTAIHKCRYLIHLAAFVSVPASHETPEVCRQINVDGTKLLLEAADEAGVQRVVFNSSCAVYGSTHDQALYESSETAPGSPYAESKLLGEELVANFKADQHGGISLRLFNVFGPRQDPNGPYAAAIPQFLDALRTGRQPVIFGDGLQTRDFVYVEDVVRATASALLADQKSPAVFNVGSGQEHTILEVLIGLAAALDMPVHPRFESPRQGDIRRSWASIELAHKFLDFKPEISLEEGLKRLTKAS